MLIYRRNIKENVKASYVLALCAIGKVKIRLKFRVQNENQYAIIAP